MIEFPGTPEVDGAIPCRGNSSDWEPKGHAQQQRARDAQLRCLWLCPVLDWCERLRQDVLADLGEHTELEGVWAGVIHALPRSDRVPAQRTA